MIQPNIFGVFSLFIFHAISIYILFPSRYGKAKTVTALCCTLVLSFGFCWLAVRSSTSFVSMAIALCTAVFLSCGVALFVSAYDVPKTLFLFLAYAQIFIIAITLAAFISQRFFGGSSLSAMLSRSALHVGVIFLCAVLRKRFSLFIQGTVHGWWPLNLVEILCFAYTGVFVLRVYDDPYGTMDLIAFFLFLAVIIAVYGVFFHTIRYMNRAAEQEKAELQNKFLLEQVKTMQESVEEARCIRHDARHHNLQIAEYVKNGETDALLQYLHEYEQEAEKHQVIRICDNLAANSILSVYSRKAEQNGIAVYFDVSIEQNIGVSDIDMVAILANIMENAIHGCVHSKKQNPIIDVYIGRKAGKLVIYVCNTADTGIIFENGRPRSRKGGVGINSVLHSVSRYGGESDFKLKDGLFCCQLLLKIPAPNEKS